MPLETEILGMGLSMLRSGHATFHGFALAQAMREQSGSRALTGHGTLYKALGRLEEFGLLSSRWEDAAAVEGRPRRRLYELTGEGARVAETALAESAPAAAGTEATDRLGARMTPERMAEQVSRWVRWYTRNLPAPIAERRIDEIAADLHDHIAHERAHGTTDPRIGLSLAARMLRGMAADASWRRRTMAHSPTRKDSMKSNKPASRSAVRVVVLATAFILLLPLVAMQLTDEVDWGVADFVLAGALLGGTGLLLVQAVQKANSVAYRAVAVAIGVAAIVLGEADDAPGLVLFGLLLIAATVALTVRTALRSE